MVNSFKDLIVWQKSMDLAREIYTLSERFPKSESFSLTNQIRRAAVSIPSNIAEGYGRYTTPEYIRFLSIANGSLLELNTQILLAVSLGYIAQPDIINVENLIAEISKMLNSLRNKLSNKNLSE